MRVGCYVSRILIHELSDATETCAIHVQLVWNGIHFEQSCIAGTQLRTLLGN